MTWIEVDLEGIVVHGPLEITDKLNECRFFLGLMKGSRDWAQFRWLTSACLNAARAALDWLAWSAYYTWSHTEVDFVADRQAIERLSKYLVLKRVVKTGKVYASPRDPLLRELCDHRRVTAHEGPLAIKPEKVASPQEFAFRDGGKRVIPFCQTVMKLLTRMQDDIRARS